MNALPSTAACTWVLGQYHRTARRISIAAGVSAMGTALVLAGALLVDGSLTQPSAAATAAFPLSRLVADAPVGLKTTFGLQLPTLPVEG